MLKPVKRNVSVYGETCEEKQIIFGYVPNFELADVEYHFSWID